MGATQQLSITLPDDMAEAVRAKVAGGNYANESEVVRDGLRVLLERDKSFETWLLEVAAPAYDAMMADPSRGIAIEDVRAALAAEHAELPDPQ